MNVSRSRNWNLTAGAHAMLGDDIGTALDDRLAVLDCALMVVGKVEHEQIVEVEPFQSSRS